MPVREKLLEELQNEQDVGVLLMAQLGGVPNEIQIIIQTARYDDAVQGLRERPGGYIIRCISTIEHRLSLGLFGSLFFTDEHPILLHHNEPKIDVNFSGKPADASELIVDIQQAFASTFGPWRELAADINREQPLFTLLQSGTGRLGSMPRSAAQRMVRVLEHHGMSGTLDGDVNARPDPQYKMLGVGDAYFVAVDFSVERMGDRR